MAHLYVDDVRVGKSELLAELGIDTNQIPSKLERIFEINPDRVTKDEHGNPKTPRRMGVKTKFSVYSKQKQRNVVIRYAEVENNIKDKSGVSQKQYAPAQLFIHGKEQYVADDVAFLFMFLHTDCFNSPIRPLDRSFRFLFKDNEDIAAKEILKEEQEMRALSLIIGENAYTITQLRQIAKGLNIPGVDNLSDVEVKAALKKIAKQNPNKFFDDARSNTIIFNGLLQDAIDQNVVTIVSNNGYKRWYFNKEELCIIPHGTDELKALKEAVVKRMDYLAEFKAAIEGRSVESEIEKPEHANFFNQFKEVTSESSVTKQSVSTKENDDLEKLIAYDQDIKLLMEQEDLELSGGDKMHFKRREKLEKPQYREAVDKLRASLVTEQQ